jgi:hypothetical protein
VGGIATGNTIGYAFGMKLSVSLSERLCKEAGAAAKALGVSRNKLVQTALKEFLERRRDEILTRSIDQCIEKYGSDLSEEDEAWIAQGQETAANSLKTTSRVRNEGGPLLAGRASHDENRNLDPRSLV